MKSFKKEVPKYNLKRSVHFQCKILNSKLYLCKLNFIAKNHIYYETKSLLDKNLGKLNFLAKNVTKANLFLQWVYKCWKAYALHYS